MALLKALYTFKHIPHDAMSLGEKACEIEIEKLNSPVGKQDQYIAAYGGLQFIRFAPTGEVFVDPIVCTKETRSKLEDSCLLFFTGLTREAKSVLQEQKNNSGKANKLLCGAAQPALPG